MKIRHGFTIVELLIVIVIIAVLASISVVAYNGVQTRSKNTRIISTAREVAVSVQSYIATYGKLPLSTNQGLCATVDNVCTNLSGTINPNDNSAYISEIRKISNPPQSLPDKIVTNDGSVPPRQNMQSIYTPGSVFNGENDNFRLEYYLQGDNVNCQLSVVDRYTGNDSTTGYTYSDAGVTACWHIIPFRP